MKRLCEWLALLLVPILLFCPAIDSQGGSTAALELPNVFTLAQTFTQGIAIQGQAGSGYLGIQPAPEGQNYTLTLPGSGGISGYYLCIGSTPGSWTYCGVGGGTAPAVTLTPSSANYGSVQTTTSKLMTFVISNSGNAQLTFTGSPAITITGSSTFTKTTTCGTTLDAGASCNVVVTFTPTAVTAYSATLNVADNAAGSPQTAALSGSGVAVSLSITNVSPTFGPPGTLMTITGTGFTSDAAVTFSNATTSSPVSGATTFVSSTQLKVIVPALALGKYNETVTEAAGSVTHIE